MGFQLLVYIAYYGNQSVLSHYIMWSLNFDESISSGVVDGYEVEKSIIQTLYCVSKHPLLRILNSLGFVWTV
jgi:hypothetical protein